MKRLAILLLAACAFAQQGRISLEQLLGTPFPTEMTASPTGGHIAWVQKAKGVRNIWTASPPEYQAAQLTAYIADDGQEIAQLSWTPDASAIVFVRGGAANRNGEIPNPTSDPVGAQQSIWVVPASGGQPRRLAEGASPAASPDSKSVAYIAKGQVWSVTLEGGAAKQLIQARGQAGSLRWSPDGALLAMVSNRGDHSFIGVYDLAAKTLRYLDPSLDRDSNPVFSPDGKQIAFLRVAATAQISLFGPKRTADPWSIRVADTATAKGKQIWSAEPGRGSVFHAVTAENQILWSADGNLVFPWERDGWLHLYSVPPEGGGARLLTHGEFEVEHVSLSPDGKEILYSANSDDIDRRHLFRVPAAGGPVTPLTSGKGIEWFPVMTSDAKALAFFRSDARLPARAAIQMAFGAPRDLVPVDFPGDALVEPEAVVISAADGMKIRGQLFLPAGGGAEKKPAVIFFHGGSRRQMLLGWHYLDYYHNTYAFNQYLASQGYIVLSVNYRSGTGYGMEFREAFNYGATGASEFNDVLGAGLYLQSRPDVDSARIGLWGGSYGGYLTALGLARASNLFAAGVDIHGVHDWNVVIRNFEPRYDPIARQQAATLAFESSPLAHVKGWRSPVLLIHGDDDRNVPFSESVTLAEALRKQGVPFEQLVFPDEVHGFLRYARWLELFEASARFLDRHLKRKQ
ncbi:MAG: S9 family peptidase [Acidimicrobiia bacterium]|nr:S9 family peptidase [Acidimicrobiia bacterium]